MLREMTSSAFAHSFKRFARLAVAGLALAGLAACGGGNGSNPSPNPPQMSIMPLNEYGSMAHSMNPWGGGAFGRGTSPAAARTEAVAACENNYCPGSSSCGCQQVLSFRNACGSWARSADNNIAAVGWGTTESAAGQSATNRCQAAGGQQCTVVAAANNRPFTFCAKAGSGTPDGYASTIPPRPASQQQQPTPSPVAPSPQPEPQRYVSIYYGERNVSTSRFSSAWAVRQGTSAAAAERAARTACENLLGSGCTLRGQGTTMCTALALTDCNGCTDRAGAIAYGGTLREARNAAIFACTGVRGGDGSCQIRADSSYHSSACGSAGQ